MSGIIGISPDMKSGVIGKYPTGSIIKTESLPNGVSLSQGTGYIWHGDTNKYVSCGTLGPFTTPSSGADIARVTFKAYFAAYKASAGTVTDQFAEFWAFFKTASVATGTETTSWDASTFGTTMESVGRVGLNHTSVYDGWCNSGPHDITYNLAIDGSTLSAGTGYYFHIVCKNPSTIAMCYVEQRGHITCQYIAS